MAAAAVRGRTVSGSMYPDVVVLPAGMLPIDSLFGLVLLASGKVILLAN